jgi:hypothetical protein
VSLPRATLGCLPPNSAMHHAVTEPARTLYGEFWVWEFEISPEIRICVIAVKAS